MRLASVPDLRRAMELVADEARRLSGATSSVIFLLERGNTFKIVARSPISDAPGVSPPRQEGGLARQILRTFESVLIPNTTVDARVRPEIVVAGIRSLIGVPLRAGEALGVLFLNGARPNQFGKREVDLATALAGYASLAIGWSYSLLAPAGEVSQATSRLFSLKDTLDETCKIIQSRLHFDFVSIQLIRHDENVIETVSAVGGNAPPIGMSKHSLAREKKLRDIQADIVKTGNTEIISGWDSRFDPWIFKTQGHADVVRIFTPIALARHRGGHLVDRWFRRVTFPAPRRLGHRLVYPPPVSDLAWEILGTVEAGSKNSARTITPADVEAVREIVADRATRIRRSLLPSVLDVILTAARKIVRADSATLHFFRDPYQAKYVVEAASGLLGERLRPHPPRSGGLGSMALKTRTPQFVPDPSKGHAEDQLRTSNPDIWRLGVRAIAAFPLSVGSQEGVLYTHFRHSHQMTEDELGWVALLSRAATDAIHHVASYAESGDLAQQIATLREVTESLGRDPGDAHLLEKIASTTLNVLGADIVTIYEYLPRDRLFKTPPVIAGRLLHPRKMTTRIHKDDAPELLLRYGQNVYEPDARTNRIFCNPDRTPGHPGATAFVPREDVTSAAGVILKVAKEVVGVMFLNYRRRHTFRPSETRFIESLAYAASVAVEIRRWLHVRRAADDALRGGFELSEMLKLILEKAVRETEMQFGYIETIDPDNRTVRRLASYPPGAHRQRERLPRLSADLGSDETIGRLVVHGRRDEARLWTARQKLEVLANSAFVAIQSSEARRRQASAEAMAAVADFSQAAMHGIKNDVGAIRTLTQKRRFGEKERATIERLSEQVLGQVKGVGWWAPEESAELDLRVIADEVAERATQGTDIQCVVKMRDIPKISAAEAHINQLLLELVQNAMAAVPRKGGLIIIAGEEKTTGSKSWIEISVSDNGKGVPKDKLEKIFERGYTTKPSGFGFGLWWIKSFVERQGGRITPTRLSPGMKFSVLFPHERGPAP